MRHEPVCAAHGFQARECDCIYGEIRALRAEVQALKEES